MKTATRQKSPAAISAAGDRIAQEQFWFRHLDEAQKCWNKLSREQLLHSEGMPHRLSRLLQEHYDLSREQAEHQILCFKDSCQHLPEVAQLNTSQDIN
ncbi:hypothetical protein WH43_12730 [Rheinheimera sp. KL1]|uniref:hypothetical protein n=1 Tax=Rheinheimera sp. KL1 TaxID=1635005 RepID=UPI0006A9510B|nr:hypothetical protein [Rheinheimera sp. KL1]KOO57942.1 hypothetical protein WH43_12730 [Rheinheimera sp. KL1]